MVELNYSIEAQNVLNQFYDVDKMVYVEGDDDVSFWEFLFRKLSKIKVKVEGSGGKSKLQAKMEEIRQGKANFYVAVDSDLEAFSDVSLHPQILRTFGYSMENTMISEFVLKKVIKTIAQLPEDESLINDCIQWLEKVENSLKLFVLTDIVGQIYYHSEESIVTDNCDRFLTSKNSSELCPIKIKAHLKNLNIEIHSDHKKKIKETMVKNGTLWRDIIRGHFLMSAAFRFVKGYCVKRITISKDMFLSNVMLAFEITFDDQHRHYEYYRSIFSQV